MFRLPSNLDPASVPFNLNDTSYQVFKNRYLQHNWIKRKVIALPLAFWTGTVKTIAHISIGIFIGLPKMFFDKGIFFKIQDFNVIRDFQESFGHLTSLFNDRYGLYHTQQAQRNKLAYRNLLNFGPAYLFSKTHENIQFDDETTSIRELVNTVGSSSSSEVHKNLGKVYIRSNKSNLTKARDRLSIESNGSRKVHIGCSGWHNFDIMCYRKSTHGVIFDYDPQNKIFINSTLSILRQSNNRNCFIKTINEFIDKTKENIQYDDYLHGYPSLEASIQGELNREESWLSTDENFMYMKQLAEKGKIISWTVNIARSNAFQMLSDLLRKKELKIDTVYLSNIRGFIPNSDKETFIHNLNHIVRDDTLVINCPKFTPLQTGDEDWFACNLRQHVCPGSELSKDTERYFNFVDV